MSTSYYRLKEPFSSVRLEEGPAHDRITLWEDGANAGTLTVSKGEGRKVVMALAEMEIDASRVPYRTYWGGKDRGAVVYQPENYEGPELADTASLISEYGDILTVAEVKSRDGARRKDGWPTELFGYEATS